MSTEGILHSGRGSRPAAVLTGIVATVLFGALAAALLLGTSDLFLHGAGALLGLLASISIPWQILDAKRREHVLTERGLHYRCGVIGRFEVEIPYTAMRGVVVRQGLWQRPLGCADVRIAAPGVSGPVLISSRDYNSVVLRSVPDFAPLVELLKERIGG